MTDDWVAADLPLARTGVVSAVFGPRPVVPRNLDAVRDWAFRGDGVGGWLNGTPAHTLWWVLTQRDGFRRRDAHALATGLAMSLCHPWPAGPAAWLCGHRPDALARAGGGG